MAFDIKKEFTSFAWLMGRQSLDQTPEIKYYLSNAPPDADLQRMAVVGSERWRVEGAIKEAKSRPGLDESEGRNWNHWHHHTTLSILTHAFLTCARIAWSRTHPPSRCDGPESSSIWAERNGGMRATRFFPFTIGKTNTWPTPVNVTRDGGSNAWRKLDVHKLYLGLYN